MSGEEATRFAAANQERVSEEMADVAIYLLELADITGIDLV
jgi:NTP pyrophosphatase (non-canonical NTP hydrolase)